MTNAGNGFLEGRLRVSNRSGPAFADGARVIEVALIGGAADSLGGKADTALQLVLSEVRRKVEDWTNCRK